MRNVRACTAVLAALLLSACSSTFAGPTPTPAGQSLPPLVDPYPNTDVKFAQASPDLQRIWKPYEVLIIPNRNVPDSGPAPPKVVNATGGLVSDDDAQHWATAFFRTQTWLKWAAARGQAGFIKHIDHRMATYQFESGATETLPDCALYPTTMELYVDQGFGDHGDRSHFAFLNTYTGPCTAVFNEPDGTQQKDGVFSVAAGTKTVEHLGALRSDPLLQDVWTDNQAIVCDLAYCVPPPKTPPPEVAIPPLPDVVTLYSQASPSLQAAWAPYQVTVVPPKSVLTDIPALPPLSNDSNGVIDDQTAKLWEKGVMLEAAWATFSWTNLQTDFQRQIAGERFYGVDQKLNSAAYNGGKPDMLPCALFPTALTLQPISDKERSEITFADRDQWVFVATYSRPCTINITYANGTTGSTDLPETLMLYGELREDPVLGDIWFTDTVATPQDLGG